LILAQEFAFSTNNCKKLSYKKYLTRYDKLLQSQTGRGTEGQVKGDKLGVHR